MRKLQQFLGSMLSEDSKISSKRVITFTAALMFFFYVTPVNMYRGKMIDHEILDVYKWIILGGMGITAALSGVQAMASKKGSIVEQQVNKQETTVITDKLENG